MKIFLKDYGGPIILRSKLKVGSHHRDEYGSDRRLMSAYTEDGEITMVILYRGKLHQIEWVDDEDDEYT